MPLDETKDPSHPITPVPPAPAPDLIVHTHPILRSNSQPPPVDDPYVFDATPQHPSKSFEIKRRTKRP